MEHSLCLLYQHGEHSNRPHDKQKQDGAHVHAKYLQAAQNLTTHNRVYATCLAIALSSARCKMPKQYERLPVFQAFEAFLSRLPLPFWAPNERQMRDTEFEPLHISSVMGT